jgi:hydrogenase-1 operon protein HyaF
MDTLILNSIEVVGMPEVALASGEDFADSVERLREYLDMMSEPI